MGLDALLRPVGPLPPRAYWVRRTVVLVVAIVLVLLLAKACSGGSSSDRATTRRTAAAPTATAAAGVAPTGQASTVAPTPSATATAPVTAPACEDRVLRLAAAPAAAVYPAGAPPVLTLSVTNTGAAACSRDLGPAQRGFVITSGADRIWSSTDCAPVTPAPGVLLPGKAEGLRLSWDRHRSVTGCPMPQAQPLAQPGTYVLTARLGSLTVAGGSFSLTG